MISSIRFISIESSVKKHWLSHSWQSSNQHSCTCWRGLAFKIVNSPIMCTSCHNEPLDFVKPASQKLEHGSFPTKLTHLPSFSGSSQKSHTSNSHLLIWVLHLIKDLWLKFQSSFSTISISDVHKNQTAAWTLTFHYRFSASAKTKQSGEIHHGGPAINDSNKCGHVHVKGHVWHWPNQQS